MVPWTSICFKKTGVYEIFYRFPTRHIWLDATSMTVTCFDLSLIGLIARGAVFADEREDIGVALTTLSVRLDDLIRYPDHPLVDLFQTVHMCSHSGDLVYLSGEHRALLLSAARVLRVAGGATTD